jgi:hypothetical protein
MTFFWFILFIIALPIVLVFWRLKLKMDRHKELTIKLNKVAKNQLTYIGHPVDNGFSIAVSEPLQTLYFISQKGVIYQIPYKDVIDCEILLDGYSYQYSKLGSVIDRSIIGSFINGSTGAIIGGLSARKIEKHIANSMVLKVICDNTNLPFFEVTFLNFDAKKGSQHYLKAYNNLKSWDAVITKILSKNKSQITIKTEGSISDELAKLNDLYQRGILTEDEFKQAKQKIIN